VERNSAPAAAAAPAVCWRCRCCPCLMYQQ
jgi:hypothetical protein